MSFSLKIKQEILRRSFNTEEACFFIDGLAATAIEQGNLIEIRTNNSEISWQIRDLLKQLRIIYNVSSDNKNWFTLNNYVGNSKILIPAAYFSGVFLGGGSISDPSSTSYHLELQFSSQTKAKISQVFLNKYDFNFVLIQRRKRWVLYIKKSEQISDFLKAIEAFQSLLTFEDARIKRDYQNQLNRYTNLDSYNQQKLARTSLYFKQDWLYAVENNLTNKFRLIELAFFKVKINNPYSSLAELIGIFRNKTGQHRTKSAFNHWLIKLRFVVSIHKKSV